MGGEFEILISKRPITLFYNPVFTGGTSFQDSSVRRLGFDGIHQLYGVLCRSPVVYPMEVDDPVLQVVQSFFEPLAVGPVVIVGRRPECIEARSFAFTDHLSAVVIQAVYGPLFLIELYTEIFPRNQQ